MSYTDASTADPMRRPALLAGPTAVVSLVLFGVTIAVHGDDTVAAADDPIAIGQAVLGLLSLLLLLVGLARLAVVSETLRTGSGPLAVALAAAGTVLTAGGAWSMVFVVPGLAGEAPEVVEHGLTSVTTGFVLSFVLAGLGWILVAVRLRHDSALRTGLVRLLMVGGVLFLAPLPGRWFLTAVAVSLLSRAEPAPVGARRTALPAQA